MQWCYKTTTFSITFTKVFVVIESALTWTTSNNDHYHLNSFNNTGFSADYSNQGNNGYLCIAIGI